MSNRVWVGIFVGLIFSSTMYVIQSESFTRTQKIFLLIAAICFPIQWIGILVCLIYNNYKDNNTVEKISEKKIEQKVIGLDTQIENLKDLKEKGILTEDEFNQKVSKIEQEKSEENLKNSQEYKQLKSLLDSGILTKDEFESKTKLIKIENNTNPNNILTEEQIKDNKQADLIFVGFVVLLVLIFVFLSYLKST